MLHPALCSFRHIAALQKANKKLLVPPPAASASKVFSAKAIFDNVKVSADRRQSSRRGSVETQAKRDDRFSQFQVDEMVKQVRVRVRVRVRVGRRVGVKGGVTVGVA